MVRGAGKLLKGIDRPCNQPGTHKGRSKKTDKNRHTEKQKNKHADKCEKKACIFIQIGLLWSQFKNDKGIDTYRIVHKLDTDRIRVYSDDDFIDIPMSNVLSKKKIGTLIINWEER